MDRLEAYERRAWRLAMLLTGDGRAADVVVQACIDAQAKPDQLPAARLDRLVIQAARQSVPSGVKRPLAARLRSRLDRARADHRVRRGRPEVSIAAPSQEQPSPFSPDARRALDALRSLPPQQREAWILRELDSVEVIEASKAMDCSKTALARHLELATKAMSEALGEDEAEVVAALKRDADNLDPEPFIRRRRVVRHNRRAWRIRLVIIATLVAIIVALVVWRLIALRGAAPA